MRSGRRRRQRVERPRAFHRAGIIALERGRGPDPSRAGTANAWASDSERVPALWWPWSRAWRRWPIAAYDRVYRWANGLDRPGSCVGSVLRLTLRRSRRTVRLASGAVVRRGDPIVHVHLDNDRVAALHGDSRRPEAVGLEFRRRFLASLAELAALTEPDGCLRDVRACSATTILHRGLGRMGFEPEVGDSGGSVLVGIYQRALLGVLRPLARRRAAPVRRRARQLWISREDLRARYLKAGSTSRPNRSICS